MKTTGHKKGLQAEALAKLYLQLKGYGVLEERFKTPMGEIDLIVKKGGVVAFVEVKLRKTEDAAAEAIHAKNQSRVRNAAELYLQKHPEYNECELRFDALVMAHGAWPQHILSAW
jgi:putative endonuclease